MNEQDVLQRWLTDIECADVKDTNERAVGWVTVSVDLEFGHLYIRGPYPTPEVALIAAAKDEEEVNRDKGDDPGWKVTVHPLMP